ncbi:MAG: glycosyltransferase family 9 protein [Planctomycetota bacterium]
MCAKNNIVEQIREKIARMSQESQRGVILQPGAIGDCILTLPLAEFMKETVCRGGVDIIGHTEYIGILPGRSSVDAVISTDAMDLHRLFIKESEFALADGDLLIMSFADYTWIVTFLGGSDSDFEQNLIFTANCSHSAEVMTLEMKPKEGKVKHISDFYKEQFVAQSGLSAKDGKPTAIKPLIRPTQADRDKGREILDEAGVSQTLRPVIIHPGSGGVHKCWHLDNFLSAAGMLAKQGAEVVFLIGPAEQERFGEATTAKIGFASRILSNLPLTDVLAVLSCARGYIGNDSGITHLAAALGLRTVAVFGPTEPAVYGPVGPAVTVLRSKGLDFTAAISKELQEKTVTAMLEDKTP